MQFSLIHKIRKAINLKYANQHNKKTSSRLDNNEVLGLPNRQDHYLKIADKKSLQYNYRLLF